MADQKQIDELIKMLDDSMSSGSGHVNVVVNDEKEVTLEEVTVNKGMDCSMGDTACKIPNIILKDEENF